MRATIKLHKNTGWNGTRLYQLYDTPRQHQK